MVKALKRPALAGLWLRRAVPVYVVLIVSLVAVKFGLTAYLQHKYPPVVKNDRVFGVRLPFLHKVYHDRWLVEYDKWSLYAYILVAGLAGVWMLVLLKSTAERANGLVQEALEKAENARTHNELSRSMYNLKVAASYSLDESQRQDLHQKIEHLKSRLSARPAAFPPAGGVEHLADPGKTVVRQSPVPEDTLVQRYHKIEKLGQGAMGIVWLAEDRVLERRVAVKELPVHIAEDREFKERFFREAKILARLTHPNIVQLYDIVEDGDTVYYTMEYVEGQSLDRLSKGARLPLNTTLDYALQILRGMEYAHRMKIIHRDLKPMNILVRKDNIIKIADFGLAKLVGSSGVTMAGTVMGSPLYMSPEQAMGEETDERSDIYSFSMVLYELVAGTPAFTGMPKDVIAQQIQAMPAKPSTVITVPRWIDDMIMKGLAKDKAQRYQSVSEIIAEITEKSRPV